MEKNISESLITTEPSLQDLEEKIEAGLEQFRVAGESLRKIKEKKLYKSEYSTYEEYCSQRWGFTPQHANRLISAAKTMRLIEESEPTGSVLPQSENQVRVLSKSKDPNSTWKSAQEDTGKKQPTAKDIEAYLQDEEDKDAFDAEIIEDNTIESKVHDAAISSLLSIINQPYSLGGITGTRRQLNTNVDDATIERISRLKERMHSDAKGAIMAQSLLLMERFLDLQDPANTIYDPNETLVAETELEEKKKYNQEGDNP